MRIVARFRSLALVTLAALFLAPAAAHAAGFPPAEKIPALSLAVEASVVDTEADAVGWLTQIGASLQLARWFAVRGGALLSEPGDAKGGEIDAVFLFPARLEVLTGVGTLRTGGDGATFARAGVYFRAWEAPFAAVVVGLGVARTEPNGGDSETDTYLSVGWRGR